MIDISLLKYSITSSELSFFVKKSSGISIFCLTVSCSCLFFIFFSFKYKKIHFGKSKFSSLGNVSSLFISNNSIKFLKKPNLPDYDNEQDTLFVTLSENINLIYSQNS